MSEKRFARMTNSELLTEYEVVLELLQSESTTLLNKNHAALKHEIMLRMDDGLKWQNYLFNPDED